MTRVRVLPLYKNQAKYHRCGSCKLELVMSLMVCSVVISWWRLSRSDPYTHLSQSVTAINNDVTLLFYRIEILIKLIDLNKHQP